MKNNNFNVHNTYKKRIPGVFLAVILAISVTITGCGGKSSSTSSDSQTSQQDTGSESAGKEKITVGLQTDSYITDYDDNYLTKLLEKELGIDLEIYQLPSDGTELKSKVSIMIAAVKIYQMYFLQIHLLTK